jgi:hypothetical protein
VASIYLAGNIYQYQYSVAQHAPNKDVTLPSGTDARAGAGAGAASPSTPSPCRLSRDSLLAKLLNEENIFVFY